ncbi:MAG TPA: short-chain fatty acid transporter [Candidatus Avacidaminococcus intestinavium]|uniref:Short-chain fatty acid transporter n=1 Tax=Candidatus Avacidaminococcus intestinavium TaxID=2840684 RepID=A0A9D1MQH7_9FIRM|nr:short-chain fatty acid transporter [Candidatus Avacidaminococcus intestinavium]
MSDEHGKAQGTSQGIVERINNFAHNWIPDSYVIALTLTLLALLLAITLTPSTPYEVVQAWGQGFWVLLEFSMQMVLIVITGYALATTPICQRLMRAICMMPSSSVQVYLWGVVFSSIAYYLNWGFGLVFAALLAKELGKQADYKGIKVDYRLLCGANWTSYYFFHMGLSGSAPLLVATPTHFMVKEIGVIPVAETLFSSYTLTLTAISFIAVVLLYAVFLVPKDLAKVKTMRELRPDFFALEMENKVVAATKIETPSQWLTNTPYLSYIVGIMFVGYLYYHFVSQGKSLDINILNTIFLMLIILLYGTPAKLLAAVKESTSAATGIIIQFPFYAGIFGIMTHTGLVDVFSNWIIGFSTHETFTGVVALLTGAVGYFIPSGGSKWAVVAPFLVPAANNLGIPISKVVTAYMFGCDWANLIQPFFAIPFIAVAGLEFRDFAAYSFISFLVLGVIMLAGLIYLPF